MNLTPPSTGNEELDTFLYQLAQYVGGVQQASPSSVPLPGGYSPSGSFAQYPLRYIHVKFADDDIGTGMTDLPAGKLYLGLYNSSSAVESVTPADYTWLLVSGGGMGATKRFWYRTIGGAYLDYALASASPGNLFTIDLGGAIDLNINVTAEDLSGRVAYAKATTQQLASAPFNVATFGNATFPVAGTWGFAEVWQGTVPVVAGNEILFQLDGVYNASTNTTVWGSPYLAAFKVGQLSAIQANLGAITAGAAAIGTAPAINGTTMTGAGLQILPSGAIAIGNSTNNFVFNAATGVASINGFQRSVDVAFNALALYSGAATSNLSVDLHNFSSSFNAIALQRNVFLPSASFTLQVSHSATVLTYFDVSIQLVVRRFLAGVWTPLVLDGSFSVQRRLPMIYNTASLNMTVQGTGVAVINPASLVQGEIYRLSYIVSINTINPNGGGASNVMTAITLNTEQKIFEARI